MKLVIDIAEEMWADINSNMGMIDFCFKYPIREILKNGTPLEKHDVELLHKIQEEIEQMPSELTTDGRRMVRRGSVFRIIDKYVFRIIDKYRKGDKE